MKRDFRRRGLVLILVASGFDAPFSAPQTTRAQFGFASGKAMRLRQVMFQGRRPYRLAARQHTLCGSVWLDGIGVHTARPARVTLHPADAGSGLVFHRTGPSGSCDGRFIPALAQNVISTELATRLAPLGAGDDATVGTVEHVLAALSALGIDNALIEVDGPEIPILDGSARPFVEAIATAGIVAQEHPRRVLEILAPVRVGLGESFAEFLPGGSCLTLDVTIDFADPAVGRQRRVCTLDPASFVREIAPARTFGFIADVERLWRAGYAAGSSLDNTVAIADGRILNAEGLRAPDEFVRHKMLDAIGDLALAGATIHGTFRSYRGGHALNHAALSALLAAPQAWRIVEGDTTHGSRRLDAHFPSAPT